MLSIWRKISTVILVIGMTAGITNPALGQSTQGIDLGAASGFNVFVLGDISAGSVDMTGRLAVGGNATFNGFTIGAGGVGGEHEPIDPNGLNAIINGNVNLLGPMHMQSGSAYVGSTSGTGSIEYLYENNGPVDTNPINFDEASTYLNNLSTSIADVNANGDATIVNGNELLISSTGSGTVVVEIPASALNGNMQVRFDTPNADSVIVNVTGGGSFTWPQWEYYWGTQTGSSFPSNKVLWNIPEVTEMTSNSGGLRGSILAPNSTFNFLEGQMNGQLIVKNLYGQGGAESGGKMGEAHNYLFVGATDIELEIPGDGNGNGNGNGECNGNGNGGNGNGANGGANGNGDNGNGANGGANGNGDCNGNGNGANGGANGNGNGANGGANGNGNGDNGGENGGANGNGNGANGGANGNGNGANGGANGNGNGANGGANGNGNGANGNGNGDNGGENGGANGNGNGANGGANGNGNGANGGANGNGNGANGGANGNGNGDNGNGANGNGNGANGGANGNGTGNGGGAGSSGGGQQLVTTLPSTGSGGETSGAGFFPAGIGALVIGAFVLREKAVRR